MLYCFLFHIILPTMFLKYQYQSFQRFINHFKIVDGVMGALTREGGQPP